MAVAEAEVLAVVAVMDPSIADVVVAAAGKAGRLVAEEGVDWGCKTVHILLKDSLGVSRDCGSRILTGPVQGLDQHQHGIPALLMTSP